MRGRFRSRPLDSILKEAAFLAENGKREMILVSQEATLWGYDLPGHPTTLDLLRELEKIDGIEWIRLMYLYPAALTTEHIEYLAGDNKTLNYFDLPLQHVNTDILSAMRRQVTRPDIERILRQIREISSEAIVRTTFIVGFPGETDQRYVELRDFIEDYRFDRLGVFTYSPEEGTPSEQFDNQVPEAVKEARLDELMSIQREIAFEKNNNLIGHTVDVIIDSLSEDGVAVGRTRGDCPEIDQEVFVTGEDLAAGRICAVRIDAADGYDLHGTKVGDVA
jgi:ribosomal protein S12 methylthiotransferase